MVELDYACSGGDVTGPDTWEYIWGNGIILTRLDPTQHCDDGNTDGGDGWTDSCQVEDNWICKDGNETTQSIWNEWVLDHWVTWAYQDHTKWGEWEIKYRLDEEMLCEEDAVLIISRSSKLAKTTSLVVSGVGASTIVGISVIGATPPNSLWAMINQMQIFSLLTISENFIPDDPKNLLVGTETMSFDMSFLPTPSIPFVDDFEEWSSFKQGKF